MGHHSFYNRKLANQGHTNPAWSKTETATLLLAVMKKHC